jgi:hypothetical protein
VFGEASVSNSSIGVGYLGSNSVYKILSKFKISKHLLIYYLKSNQLNLLFLNIKIIIILIDK